MYREVNFQDFQAKLISLRATTNLTQKEVAERLSMDSIYYGDWERGKPTPGVFHFLLSVADFYKVGAGWLLGQTQYKAIPRAPILQTDEAVELLLVVDRLSPASRQRVLAFAESEHTEHSAVSLQLKRNQEMISRLLEMIERAGDQSMIQDASVIVEQARGSGGVGVQPLTLTA